MWPGSPPCPACRQATGQVFADGAKVVDKRGKVVLGTGGPRFGGNWTGDNELIKIRTGRAPTAANEIMLSANVAKTTGYAVGDSVEVLTTLAPTKRPYELVGIVGYSGGRDSLAGETSVFFTDAVAQQLMLGETGVFNIIDVKLAPDADREVIRDRIEAALGSGYSVKTGEVLAEESSEGLREAFQFINYVLLGFAGIALFVGVFLILNTFSIVVAQRTRELALFRAIGAGRGQVIWSVLAEAALIGLISSIVGLGFGIGIGALLGGFLGDLADRRRARAGPARRAARRDHRGIRRRPWRHHARRFAAGGARLDHPAGRGDARCRHAGPAIDSAHSQWRRGFGGGCDDARARARRFTRRRRTSGASWEEYWSVSSGSPC